MESSTLAGDAVGSCATELPNGCSFSLLDDERIVIVSFASRSLAGVRKGARTSSSGSIEGDSPSRSKCADSRSEGTCPDSTEGPSVSGSRFVGNELDCVSSGSTTEDPIRGSACEKGRVG